MCGWIFTGKAVRFTVSASKKVGDWLE